jgi:hypothetical protein
MARKPFTPRALGLILAAAAAVGWPACGRRPVANGDGGGAGAGGSAIVGMAGHGGDGAAGSSGGDTGGGGAAGTAGGTGAAGTVGTAGASGTTGSGGNAGGGGRGGTGGSAAGGRGGAGGVIPVPECTSAADCKLIDNCCSCQAIPVGASAAPCAATCKQNQCAATQLPAGAVACVAGQCVAGFTCDATKVTCKVATPSCPAGEVPTVNASGNCYTGSCAPETECASVGGCGACTGANEACVSIESLVGVEHHCVQIPPECNGNGGCDCLGVTACPNRTCGNYSGIRGIYCTCPAC